VFRGWEFYKEVKNLAPEASSDFISTSHFRQGRYFGPIEFAHVWSGREIL
jgi:hypothetical protein